MDNCPSCGAKLRSQTYCNSCKINPQEYIKEITKNIAEANHEDDSAVDISSLPTGQEEFPFDWSVIPGYEESE